LRKRGRRQSLRGKGFGTKKPFAKRPPRNGPTLLGEKKKKKKKKLFTLGAATMPTIEVGLDFCHRQRQVLSQGAPGFGDFTALAHTV